MVSVFRLGVHRELFHLQAGKTRADYLSQAGGPTKSADEGSIYVLRADGSVKSKQQTGSSRRRWNAHADAGHSIVVPEELDRTTITERLRTSRRSSTSSAWARRR